MLRSDSGEAQDRLRADPTLVPQFVEENLRLESPTQGLYRHTLEDVVVGDTLIPKGSTVHLRFAAANRDNRMFASPATLDLDRSNSARHMAFGVGEHHCPGAGLSRFEQTVAFETLLRRTSRLSLLDSNEYRHQAGFVLRALEQLHVGFSR